MEKKFTPGPWNWFPTQRPFSKYECIVQTQSGVEICRTGERAEDARLIAKAPQMAAFIQMIANGGINEAGEFQIEAEARELLADL